MKFHTIPIGEEELHTRTEGCQCGPEVLITRDADIHVTTTDVKHKPLRAEHARQRGAKAHDAIAGMQRMKDILNNPDLALSDRDKLELLRNFISAYEPWITLFEQFVQGYFTKEEGSKPS